MEVAEPVYLFDYIVDSLLAALRSLAFYTLAATGLLSILIGAVYFWITYYSPVEEESPSNPATTVSSSNSLNSTPNRRLTRSATFSGSSSSMADNDDTTSSVGDWAAEAAERSDTTVSVSGSPKKKRPVSAVISNVVSDAAVKTAVMLKQSPIPDTLASVTSASLTGYKRLDSAFNLQERLVSMGQGLVRAGVTATGIAATAFIKAGVAYQVAPGYRDIHGDPDDDATDGGLNSGATDPTADPTGSGGANGGLQRKRSIRSLSGTVEVLRLSSIPGTFPPPRMISTATQTEETLTKYSALAQALASPLPPKDAGAGTGTGAGAIVQKLQTRKSSSSLLSSVLSTGATVAAKVLTSSSNYVLGEETTRKLTGEEESMGLTPEAVLPCLDGPIRNINVGGKYFATTIATLKKVPGSRLARLFVPTTEPGSTKTTLVGGLVESISAKWMPSSSAANKLDPGLVAEWMAAGVMTRDGCFFIDRDGTHFQHVLNHLRGIALPLSFRSLDDLKALRIEAVYFDLVGLVVEIDERIARIKGFGFPQDEPVRHYGAGAGAAAAAAADDDESTLASGSFEDDMEYLARLWREEGGGGSWTSPADATADGAFRHKDGVFESLDRQWPALLVSFSVFVLAAMVSRWAAELGGEVV